MDKYNVIYPYNGILFHHTKECSKPGMVSSFIAARG
jgi:hypothetical protein